MAQRISRAKQTHQDVRRAVPHADRPSERAERLGAVLHVLYLIFNEGYASSVGPSLQRSDLSNEAIRLTRARARACCPDDGEVAGLLALMLLTDARRAGADRARRRADPARRSRIGRCGIGSAIAEGVALVTDDAVAAARSAPYQLQAAIAAVHDEAARAEDTDWPQILALYGLLKRMSDNPMVTLNHAIAAAMVHGPRGRARAADGARRRRAPGRPLPPRRRARAPARDGRRPRGRHRALPRRRGPDDEHPGAELPDHARRRGCVRIAACLMPIPPRSRASCGTSGGTASRRASARPRSTPTARPSRCRSSSTSSGRAGSGRRTAFTRSRIAPASSRSSRASSSSG